MPDLNDIIRWAGKAIIATWFGVAYITGALIIIAALFATYFYVIKPVFN